MKRCVFVTGASGAIGSALVPVLLEDPGTHVRLLIRARDTKHLKERLAALVAFWGIDPDAPRYAGRVKALRGDVVEPYLGLDAETFDCLAGEVTHIVHAAGNVRLDQPLDEARRHACGGARNVLALASKAARNGRFEKLEYLSTVGVAGRRQGLVPERPISEPRAFHNTYEQAKAEAETLVLAANAEFPVTVHRPSMVVGDARTGKIIAFQVFYHLAALLCGRKTFGLIPDVKNVRLDLVPVDYVARAIEVSMRRADARGRVFHLCGGPAHSPKLIDLVQAVRARETKSGARLPKLRRLPVAAFRLLVKLASAVTFGRTRRRLASLPHFLAYLDEAQVFDDAQTRAFFAAEGLQAPPALTYIDAILDYQRAARAQTAPQAPAAAPTPAAAPVPTH
ncbi:MAG: SDR family oxidoreductase [Planctomycetes bacterium]|nr:SDR family oxidoreductase [Planctomycetota bacterium]